MIEVLKKCTERLSEFQSHLGKLIQFFDGLNNFIDVIHKAHAKEFLAQVNNIMEIDAANANETQEVRRKEKQELADACHPRLILRKVDTNSSRHFSWTPYNSEAIILSRVN